jgi:lipoteichoic acid synthase
VTLQRSSSFVFSNSLSSARDWIYICSLLVPFAVYSIALKTSIVLTVVSSWKYFGVPSFAPLPVTSMMWPETSFNLGYVLFWVSLFAVIRRQPLRGVLVLFFHATTVLVAVVITCSYYYFKSTGSTFDYRVIAMWLPQIEEIKPIVINGVSPSAWPLLTGVLLYTVFGPWLIVRLVGRLLGWPQRAKQSSPPKSYSIPIILGSLGIGLSLLSLLPAAIGPMRAWFPEEALIPSRSLTAPPLVNLIMTAVQEKAISSQELPEGANVGAHSEKHPMKATLQPTESERRNVVIIQLESTRAQSVTPYNKHLNTTPFLNKLAKSSLLAERAYTVVPYSSKANVAIQCGISPQLVDPVYGMATEVQPGGIPTPCLADLLKGLDYNTVYFTPSSKHFENWSTLVRNLGYEDFYPLESMPKEGFQEPSYPGANWSYEDDIMLKPSEEWLEQHRNEPFLATYHTITPHYAYHVPERYGMRRFSENEVMNRYLNCLRYQDIFLRKLFRQYKELGLYENTVFVILGDHGESFGDHGYKTHGFSLYESALRIPMLIHSPGQFKNGTRVTDPVSQLDVLPTVADALGTEIEGGIYQGSSLLEPLPKDRTLVSGCLLDKCIASVKGSEKYIYYYGDKPDELYDTARDPRERNNLVDKYAEEDIKERRDEVLAWRSEIDSIYRGSNP